MTLNSEKSIRELLKGINTTAEAISKLIELGVGPDRGPYSFSRLGNCPLQFKFGYIDKLPGTEVSRFGKNVGSAMHELGELDVLTRLHNEPDQWVRTTSLVEKYVDQNPEYTEHFETLVEQLDLFRFNFEIHRDNYVASEQKIGATLDMEWCDYDAEECWFRGIVDYLEVASGGLARIVDFKNYPSLHSNTSLNDIYNGVGCQAMGYIALIMAMDPRIRAAVYEIYYFRYGCTRSPLVDDPSGRKTVRVFTRGDIEKWWKFNQRKMLVFERRSTFPANPSQKNCQYCSHIASCDWYNQKSKDEIIAGKPQEAKNLANRIVVLREEEERLKYVLKNYTKQHGPIELDSGVKIGPIAKTRRSVDTPRFLEICAELGVDPSPYVTVSQTNAKRLAKQFPDQKTKILDTIQEETVTRTNYG